VPGPENPADVPTRPKTVQEVINIPMWTSGPGFLHLDPSKWPSLPVLEKTTDVIEGMKKEFQVFDTVSSLLPDATKSHMVYGCQDHHKTSILADSLLILDSSYHSF
jgi:hypothetical protein